MHFRGVYYMDRFFYFYRAARRWSEVIVGDMSDRVGPTNIQTPCGAYPDQIDDLFICTTYELVDGRGGFIAAAGATHARSDEQWQPYAGIMIFDRNDVSWLRRRRSFLNYVVSLVKIHPSRNTQQSWN